jgi:lipopolysaccharide export system protein LptA
VVAALLAAWGVAHAERADREKDIVLVADKGVGDDAKKTSTFEGNVVVTQGTMRITAEKVTLTEKDNFKYYVALGSPVTFRQKRDNVDEWIEGFADRAEFDDRSDVVKLFKRAKVKSSQNELTGEFISYDMRSEVAEVLGAPPGEKPNPKGTPTPRVKMIIVPQKAGEKPGEKPADRAPAKAAAPKGEPLTLRSDTEMK